ncbi:hypothetical protein LT330_006868 [Penicillium expansum]|nr:hypothetical protein LT330_006868 [Penicillium expansum]
MTRLASANRHFRSVSCPLLGRASLHEPQVATDYPEPSTAQGSNAVLSDPEQAANQPADCLIVSTDLSESASSQNEVTSTRSVMEPGASDMDPVLSEVDPDLHEPSSGINNQTSNLSESTAEVNKPTANESRADSSELEEGEIPPTPPATNIAPRLPNPRRPKTSNPRFRASNPSPEPGLGQPVPSADTSRPKHRKTTASHQVPAEGNDKPSRKRKRPSFIDTPDNEFRPPKISKTSNTNKKLCTDLGHEFAGLVSEATDSVALNFAKNILRHPVLDTVSKRLVYFSDASQRAMCGAIGIVWPTSLTSSNWEGKGAYYPISTDNTAILELFGICCALDLAIQDIDKERAIVPSTLSRTSSQSHTMTKEVLVFSDDAEALKRIRGEGPYNPEDEVGSQMEAISRHSKTLHSMGVHIELHLSPGHSGVPGNVAADAMAKRNMYELYVQTKTSWPTAEAITSRPIYPAPKPGSCLSRTARGSRGGRPAFPPSRPIIP